jgi:6-phosphogluconolactonase
MENNVKNQLLVVPDPDALAAAAADRFVRLARQAVAAHGRFSVALAGGSTPQKMYRLLAQSPRREQVEWPNVHIFWGDERFVAPNDPDSLWRMARETFLDEVPLPAANIHPMPTVGLTAAAAAAQYANTLARLFAPGPIRFDLLLLGMGDDGHTASIFPGQTAVIASPEPVVPVTGAPKPPPTRLTLTFSVINQAANVILLVTGEAKAAAVAQVLSGERDRHQWPVQAVQPANGRLLWLLDQAAARMVAPDADRSKSWRQPNRND